MSSNKGSRPSIFSLSGVCCTCQNCLRKICHSCCPYLASKDPYAGVEYSPIEGPPLTHQSLSAARASISMPTHYFPHLSGRISGQSVEEDVEDYTSNSVVTDEPKSLPTLKHQSLMSSTSYSRSKSPEEDHLSSESPYDSQDDLGVELGFVEYDHRERRIGRDIRICKTPEIVEKDSPGSDSGSEEYKMSIRSQSIRSCEQPIRMRSFQVDPVTHPHKPSMQFSVYFDEKQNLLIAHLLKAFNLPTKRPQSTSNPFAEVYLLPNKSEVFETRVLRETLNPAFDQAFKFCNVSVDDIKEQLLVVKIYLHGKHHFIGGMLFSLGNANLYGASNTTELTVYDEDEGLQDKCKGNILLSMTYHPDAGTVDILVLEASNLRKQDFIGLPNPYMKVNTIFGGNRISKWKTGAQRNTLNPVFNELCVLDIGSMSVNELQMEILVMDYDRFGRNSELGSVSFGCDAATQNGKAYWNKVIRNPNISHLCWHVITTSEPITSRLLRSPARSRKKSPVSCVSTDIANK